MVAKRNTTYGFSPAEKKLRTPTQSTCLFQTGDKHGSRGNIWLTTLFASLPPQRRIRRPSDRALAVAYLVKSYKAKRSKLTFRANHTITKKK